MVLRGRKQQLNMGDSAEIENGDELHLLGELYHFRVGITLLPGYLPPPSFFTPLLAHIAVD